MAHNAPKSQHATRSGRPTARRGGFCPTASGYQTPRGARRAFVLAMLVAPISAFACACNWDPTNPFEREAPEVNRAIAQLDGGGDARSAAALLEDYLSTGPCAEGSIGTPERVRKLPNGAFDLGLALFSVGEAFGRRFGDEEFDAGPGSPAQAARRSQIDCAIRVVHTISGDLSQPLELRARAHYLEGNLSFLDAQYEEAVKAYDEALRLAPGQDDGGDGLGRDAAWNRAIALRRIEDKKDSGTDAAPPDAGGDGGDNKKPSPDAGGKDSGSDGSSPDGGGGAPDAGRDASDSEPDASPPPPPETDGGAPPPPRASQDDRMLDQLESAPSLQQEAARKQAGKQRRVRGMADK